MKKSYAVLVVCALCIAGAVFVAYAARTELVSEYEEFTVRSCGGSISRIHASSDDLSQSLLCVSIGDSAPLAIDSALFKTLEEQGEMLYVRDNGERIISGICVSVTVKDDRVVSFEYKPCVKYGVCKRGGLERFRSGTMSYARFVKEFGTPIKTRWIIPSRGW